MKKSLFRIIALCLTAALLLSGCGVIDLSGYFQRLLGGGGVVAFEDMTYSRPDVTALETALDNCTALAADGGDVEELMAEFETFYTQYSSFYTNYSLANIHYSIDLSDTYWEKEYNYCAEKSAAVSAAYENLMYALAASPLRDALEGEDYFGEGFFDGYTGESPWSEELISLLEQEAVLQNEYYDLSSQALSVTADFEEYYSLYGSQMAELYVEMVGLRQQIAAEAGYDSYPAFAYDFYYYRDYTPTQTTDYLTQIQQELVPLYRELSGRESWDLANFLTVCTEEQTFDYVRQMAKNVGGDIADAFEVLEDGELYHISYGENKYDASFETYLYDYYEPFIFVNPTQTSDDKLTFAHEFGHFCNDYVSYGSAAGVDVAEIFSQGMEYLSLCYGEDTQSLEKLKMLDSLCVYVEQAAFSSFEQQVYALTGDALTAENVQALYAQVGSDFGLDVYGFDDRSYVNIPHFFTNPLYVISYVVSNDAALQLYQMEQAESGTGLSCYTENLATTQSCFLAFLEEAGLESPFSLSRVQQVRKTFEAVLQ